ncbi:MULTISPECIES: hypothetical protein [unclassified Mameliella]|uniref:hypothetical protein n=1 Tax=unclassified Mameliella TaxID=2630630 RepID=UPI00273E8875|nr:MULTISPECIES: hypothetical protein [unclassified Mameliella]
MTGMPSVRLGRLGEKIFSERCTRQGATCNPSTEDEHGWDYIVEFDPGHQSNLPADLHKGIFRSLVQIKTTRNRKRVAKIKLSNALKAIQTDLPCFLVLLKFDADECTGIYVRHFWTCEIERVLKRAREAHRDDNNDLHKIELQFSFNELDDVQECIIDNIYSHTLKHGSQYGQKKKSIRETIGYPEARAIGDFVFDGKVTAKDIVEGQLNDDAQLPLSHFDIRDMRFDIPASIVPQPTSGSKISITPTPRESVLRIVKGTQSFEIDAKVYIPGIVGPEHDDFRVRVKSALLDMKLPPLGGGTYRAEMNLDLQTVWDYYVVAELAECDEDDKVRFEVCLESGNIFQGNFININFRHELGAGEWSEKISKGGRLAVLLAGRQVLVDLSPDHDRIWRQFSRLAKLEPIFSEIPKKLSFEMDSPLQNDCQEVLAFFVFELGDFCHSVNLSFPVRHQNIEGEQCEIVIDQAEIHNSKRFKTEHTNMQRIARQEFEKQVEGRRRVSIVLGNGDLIDWFSSDQDRNFVTVHGLD